MTDKKVDLDANVREGLGRVIDLLLPGTDTLPAGSVVGTHQDLIDRSLTADPRLAPAVIAFGTWASESAPSGLDDVLAWDPERIEEVVFALTASYYMSPEVRTALGYPGQVRRPISEATPDQLHTPELLAPVIARGHIYVETPGT